MRTVIVDCGGFPLKHTVYLFDGEQEKAEVVAQFPIDEIANYVCDINADAVYLQGPTNYCMGMRDSIRAQLRLDCSNCDIKVEVL